MRQHILWAKAAGIDGFIVSWKSTDALNRRLEQLADLAEQENFKLAVIYQGLDFNRDPLPAERVAGDLDEFIRRFANRPAFQLFAKPLVIWSGTWKFSPQEIAQVTESRRSRILLLASERNARDYQQLASLVNGDAYYWSSVNPETYPGYQDKLVEMGKAVHQNGGLWIAPVAPGFDAHLIGGTSLVERKNGQTFRSEMNAAQASSPDALGIISWNEFSENSYIEPSLAYGTEYLKILRDVNHLPAPTLGEFDSSEPNGTFPEVVPGARIMALGGLTITILVGLIVIARRQICNKFVRFLLPGDGSYPKKLDLEAYYEQQTTFYRYGNFGDLIHTGSTIKPVYTGCTGPNRRLCLQLTQLCSLHRNGLHHQSDKWQHGQRYRHNDGHCDGHRH